MLRPNGPRQRLVYGFSHHINTSPLFAGGSFLSSGYVRCAVKGVLSVFGLLEFISLVTFEHHVIGGFGVFEDLAVA